MDKKNLPLKTKIADPKWIFFVITIPQLILLIILFDAYSLIKTELTNYEKLIFDKALKNQGRIMSGPLKKLFITGGSGFVGGYLIAQATDKWKISANYFQNPVELSG